MSSPAHSDESFGHDALRIFDSIRPEIEAQEYPNIVLVELRARLEDLLRSSPAHQSVFAPLDEKALRKPTYAEARPDYVAKFNAMKIRPEHTGVVAWYRNRILNGRARYEEVESKCGVPWWFTATIHAMEASFSFTSHLHNGDPLTARTVRVPSGRPPTWNPPSDWVSSAIDALAYKKYTGETDWSVARSLYLSENYNGWGYRNPSIAIPSPYLWCFSEYYIKGKFVADHKYDPEFVSKQCGVAVMLKTLIHNGDVSIEV